MKTPEYLRRCADLAEELQTTADELMNARLQLEQIDSTNQINHHMQNAIREIEAAEQYAEERIQDLLR